MVGGCAIAYFWVFGFPVFGFWFLVFGRALAHCLIYAAVSGVKGQHFAVVITHNQALVASEDYRKDVVSGAANTNGNMLWSWP